jgi:tRNA-2-methylthio-N6-dimethylallyladenosine synthase
VTSQQRAAQDAMVGRTVSVLFEKAGRMPGQMVGKSEYLHAVHVQGPDDLTGRIASVDIVESGPNSLAGALR